MINLDTECTQILKLSLKAANNDKFDEGLNIVADFYKDDINKEQLNMQLSILSSNISCEPTHELHTVIKYLQGLSPPQRLLLSEVCVLASLILVMPATNAVSERSFSALRRIKSYLRATMSQERLNHIMVHKHLTDRICYIEIGNEFSKGCSHHEAFFRNFLPTDI